MKLCGADECDKPAEYYNKHAHKYWCKEHLLKKLTEEEGYIELDQTKEEQKDGQSYNR